MRYAEYLEGKRTEVLEAIKPICDAFGITDYDYEIGGSCSEVLRINGTRIVCSCNSTSAIRNELIGYIFLETWCRSRTLGAFETQTKNVIKKYWIPGDYR